MGILENIFRKKAGNTGLDALPDEQLVKQIINAMITQPPSNLLKDHALPRDWSQIDYTFWAEKKLPDGSVVAKNTLWATSQKAPRKKCAAGSGAGLLVTQLYSQMRDRNQAWVRCDISITRSAIDKTPRFTVRFSQELGKIPS